MKSSKNKKVLGYVFFVLSLILSLMVLFGIMSLISIGMLINEESDNAQAPKVFIFQLIVTVLLAISAFFLFKYGRKWTAASQKSELDRIGME